MITAPGPTQPQRGKYFKPNPKYHDPKKDTVSSWNPNQPPLEHLGSGEGWQQQSLLPSLVKGKGQTVDCGTPSFM